MKKIILVFLCIFVTKQISSMERTDSSICENERGKAMLSCIIGLLQLSTFLPCQNFGSNELSIKTFQTIFPDLLNFFTQCYFGVESRGYLKLLNVGCMVGSDMVRTLRSRYSRDKKMKLLGHLALSTGVLAINECCKSMFQLYQ